MGRYYTQLTLDDRCEMAYLHTTGHSIRQIAATLDRAPSTVARELNRNVSSTQGYHPGYADQQARARRWQGSKLDRDSTLRATVLAQLQHGWSPQQVAGRLAREQLISHETIYRFIYAQMARKTEYSWRHYLPRMKRSDYTDPISPGQNLQGPMRWSLQMPLPRTLPRKTDLATLSDEHFTRLVQAYNNTPRKCLGYQTPAEVFRNHLLHFKCESTSPPYKGRELGILMLR